jgi:hypothetical protein
MGGGLGLGNKITKKELKQRLNFLKTSLDYHDPEETT